MVSSDLVKKPSTKPASTERRLSEKHNHPSQRDQGQHLNLGSTFPYLIKHATTKPYLAGSLAFYIRAMVIWYRRYKIRSAYYIGVIREIWLETSGMGKSFRGSVSIGWGTRPCSGKNLNPVLRPHGRFHSLQVDGERICVLTPFSHVGMAGDYRIPVTQQV